jgi:hypothetical protein
MDTSTANALLHLLQIAADAGKYVRTSSNLKPDEAALLMAEITRLRELAGEAGAENGLTRSTDAARFARAA